MLTHKTPFANGGKNILEDQDTHAEFINDPADFLSTNGASL